MKLFIFTVSLLLGLVSNPSLQSDCFSSVKISLEESEGVLQTIDLSSVPSTVEVNLYDSKNFGYILNQSKIDPGTLEDSKISFVRSGSNVTIKNIGRQTEQVLLVLVSQGCKPAKFILKDFE